MTGVGQRAEVRRGTVVDTQACFDVFLESVTDLSRRIGAPWEPNRAEAWSQLGALYERLGAHAAEWWVADGGERLVGYARSVERGGLFELAEFFVRPGSQSAGVGRQLLERAFPDGRGEVRLIIATPDVRALSRYYRAGTVARFPIVSLTAPPSADEPEIDLEVVRASAADLAELSALERELIEYPRDEDEFAWLLEQREAYVYRRDGRAVGFGFIGSSGSGPIGALDAADQVPILLHLESRAGALGKKEVGFEVPMINEVAMRHLLGRRYRMDPFITYFLTSRPFGRFDRFIGFSPPFVL